MNYPQLILDWVMDTVFPIKCLKCSRFLTKSAGYICKKCILLIPLKSKFECIGCKKSTPLGETCFRCSSDSSIDNLLIISDYENALVVKIIKTLKYRLIQGVVNPLSRAIKRYIFWLSAKKKFNILAENPVIIPVPLFYRRQNWRGFHQALLLAKVIADVLNCELNSAILKRVKDVKPQADIKEREQRLENMKEVFKIIDNSQIKNKTILLVDDVCTTGATLNECARVLKAGGAKKVIGLVFSRG